MDANIVTSKDKVLDVTGVWVWGLPCGRLHRWSKFSSECREYVKLTSALLGSAGIFAEGWPDTNYIACVAAGGIGGMPSYPEGHDPHPLSAHLWRSAPLTVGQETSLRYTAITQQLPFSPHRRLETSAASQESSVMTVCPHWSGQDQTLGLTSTWIFTREFIH